MITDKFDVYCERYGFTDADDALQLLNSLCADKCASIDISMYMHNPYLLLLRSYENNALIQGSNDQITICRKDKYNTVIANIPKLCLDRCIAKWYNGSCVELIMSVDNIFYKIIVRLCK